MKPAPGFLYGWDDVPSFTSKHTVPCRVNPAEIDRSNTGPSREDILNKPCPMCGCPTWGRH